MNKNMNTVVDRGITFVNLTPHSLDILLDDGEQLHIPHDKNDPYVRSVQSNTPTRKVGRVQLYKSTFGEIEGLPEPAENTIYIVSAIIAERIRREDVIAPGVVIRNVDGSIRGANGGSDFWE